MISPLSIPIAEQKPPIITTPKSKSTRQAPGSTKIKRPFKRRLPFRPVPDPNPRPILWPPEFKRTLPAGRLIGVEENRPSDSAAFFRILHYDCRRLIYDAFLDSRFRQHITCPSVARTGHPKEFFNRFTSSKTCPDKHFLSMLACGHWECLNARNGENEESDLRLADLVAFMRTSKYAYLEVSQYLYQKLVFTFSSIPEMRAFVETTPEMTLARIRFVAFIAHTLPRNLTACKNFITEGELFQTEEGDAVELFRRFTGMERLEINFFPSLILAVSTQLHRALKPLQELPSSTEIVVRIPSTQYGGLRLPTLASLDNPGRFKLLRPVVELSESQAHWGCKAYSCQLER